MISTNKILSIFILGILLLYSCNKPANKSSVLVTVLYNGTVVTEAEVYVINDTLSSHTITVTDSTATDASGQVFISNLNAGNYQIHASGNVENIGPVVGDTLISLPLATEQNIALQTRKK